MDSRQVDFFKVYELVRPFLGNPEVVAGSPGWADLDDQHPQKWASVLWAAVYWCFHEGGRQDAIADAGEQICAAAPWAHIAQAKLQRALWEKAHPWAARGGVSNLDTEGRVAS